MPRPAGSSEHLGFELRLVSGMASGSALTASACALVLALTPAAAFASPPEPSEPSEPASEASESTSAGVLVLESSAHGAEVIAENAEDGEGRTRSLGPLPLRAELPAGTWTLRIDAPGYRPWQGEVVVEAGSATHMQIEPELIDTALLIVEPASDAAVDAELRLDGELLCTLPCREMILPGDHRVTISKRRMKPLEFPLEVKQADVIELEVVLERATSRAPAIITGSVALGSLATAIGLTISADRIRRSLADDLADFEQYDAQDARFEAGRRRAVVANAMYGVSALALGLTLFYLLRQAGQPSRLEKTRTNLAWQLAPVLAPTQVGLVGELRF